MTPEEELKSDSAIVLLQRIARELADIRRLTTESLRYIRDAEADIPESYRRFVNAFHDVHDIKYMYEEHGQPVPRYILSEIERMDDRYRQILEALNSDGNVFEKVRREMSKDPNNKYDHTKLLTKPKEPTCDKEVDIQATAGGSETQSPTPSTPQA